jgi:hypothetical protein
LLEKILVLNHDNEAVEVFIESTVHCPELQDRTVNSHFEKTEELLALKIEANIVSENPLEHELYETNVLLATKPLSMAHEWSSSAVGILTTRIASTILSAIPQDLGVSSRRQMESRPKKH